MQHIPEDATVTGLFYLVDEEGEPTNFALVALADGRLRLKYRRTDAPHDQLGSLPREEVEKLVAKFPIPSSEVESPLRMHLKRSLGALSSNLEYCRQREGLPQRSFAAIQAWAENLEALL